MFPLLLLLINLVGLSGSEVTAIASASQSIGSDSLSPVLLLLNKIEKISTFVVVFLEIE